MKNGLSIVIPVFNREKYLKECIESILSQYYQGDIEIIISDDGSKDKSLEIARTYGDKVRIIEKPQGCKEQGAAGARNRGIAIAKYNYISFLDSDDYYLKGHIQRMTNALDSNNEIGYVFCRSKKEILSKNGSVKIVDWTRKKLSVLDVEYHVLSRSYCINTNTIVFRSSIFEHVGVFNADLSHGEDTDMWLRVSENYKGEFINSFGTVYRVEHGDDQLILADLEKKKKCSDRIYTEAFSRNYISSNADKLRLLLIIRALLYGKINNRFGRVWRIYGHVIVMIKLFSLFPNTFFKFIKLYRR